MGPLARVGVGVAVLVGCLTLVLPIRADGGRQSWQAYLAPVGVCADAANAGASLEVQRRSVECLINWARNRHSRLRLARSRSLQRAAELKGRKVVSCQQLSHTPCGTEATAPIQASGYSFASFGENILVGPRGLVSPRHVVKAWLESPGHRKNILNRSFREVGAASVAGTGVLGPNAEVVWVATFASRR